MNSPPDNAKPDPSPDELSIMWRSRWDNWPPIADELKFVFPGRWVRFHSLPESKRYADSEPEYDILLDRYNTILDELFRGEDVRIVAIDWIGDPNSPGPDIGDARWPANFTFWLTLCTDEDEEADDSAIPNLRYLYISRIPWHRGSIDDLLRAVADDTVSALMITSLSFDRVHHPYDGGADVLLPTSAERDALRVRHSSWLSRSPDGY